MHCGGPRRIVLARSVGDGDLEGAIVAMVTVATPIPSVTLYLEKGQVWGGVGVGRRSRYGEEGKVWRGVDVGRRGRCGEG